MIENLLLDPVPIWEAIQSVVHKIKLTSINDLIQAIDSIIDGMDQEESDRRVLDRLGIEVFRPKRPCSTIADQIANFSQILGVRYEVGKVTELTIEADRQVARLKTENRRREFFHGNSR